MNQRLKEVLVLTIILLLCLSGVCGVVITRDIHQVAQTTKATLAELQGASAEMKQAAGVGEKFITFQTDRFESDAYQKSLKASIDTPAIYNGTGRLVNTQVIPRLMKDLDSVGALIRALTDNSRSLDAFIHHTDDEINKSLLPSTVALLDRLGLSVQDLDAAIKQATERGLLTLDDVHRLASDPNWQIILAQIAASSASLNDSMKHLDGSMASVDAAMRQAPSIAASLEKIAKTSSRFTKITLTANIISIIVRAFGL
jgi:hypothetical protein